VRRDCPTEREPNEEGGRDDDHTLHLIDSTSGSSRLQVGGESNAPVAERRARRSSRCHDVAITAVWATSRPGHRASFLRLLGWTTAARRR
jgi:hypothetical protein